MNEEALVHWGVGGGSCCTKKNIYITDLINVRKMVHIKILLLLLVHPASFPNKIQCIHLINLATYLGSDKPLARPTSQCILFDGENISFDASLVI
jgi:hypothetical protein